MTNSNKSRRGILLTLAAIVIGGAGQMTTSGAALAQPKNRRTIELEIRQGKVTGDKRTIRATEDEEIDIRWTTDKAVELHLHGYDVHALAKPGRSVSMTFVAHTAGRFPISAHGHGHDRMIYLEIYPR